MPVLNAFNTKEILSLYVRNVKGECRDHAESTRVVWSGERITNQQTAKEVVSAPAR
jgi:hypothetical protein